MKAKAVIFDIDGTLAEKGDRSPFDWSKVGLDTPHKDIIQLTHLFAEAGYKIIVVTGRDGSCYSDTIIWLESNHVKFDELHSRPEGSFEKDYIIKERIYRENIEPKYKVHYVFDDRDQTVKGWRNMGLRCLQVAPGDF